LTVIVIACCLIVSQEAVAQGRYSLTGPVVTYENGGVLRNMTMVPTTGGGPTTGRLSSGGGDFAVDSFFDVFTESVLQEGQTYHIDSFFDVFTELSVDGGASFPADSFFNMFVEVDVGPMEGESTTGTFATEIVSMSLSGNTGGRPTLLNAGSSFSGQAGSGKTEITDIGGGLYHIDSFFDVFTELSVDGGDPVVGMGGGGGSGGALLQLYPDGVPSPRQVPGKEYSHHMDINAMAAPDPMQNIAWDGTGNAWDTFDYSNATNIPYPEGRWPQGTNVDAIANIQDRFFHEVVNDQVALLVTIDDGTAVAPVPGDYENIHYQTAGAGSAAGIWARGVIPGAPATSDIHTFAVQLRQGLDPGHLNRWLSPTGIEVWGPEVSPDPVAGGSGSGIGDDAIMFSTNDEWWFDASDGKWKAKPAVWKYDPVNNLVFPYIMANEIRDAIDNAQLQLVENDRLVNLDGMMIFDAEQDDEFGPGDSIMFTIHTLTDSSGGIILDGGEIWVWNFDDGPLWSATFLNHGGVLWDTANSVIGIFPNVFAEENIGGLEAVPEPATLSLLALGGLAILRRRRRS